MTYPRSCRWLLPGSNPWPTPFACYRHKNCYCCILPMKCISVFIVLSLKSLDLLMKRNCLSFFFLSRHFSTDVFIKILAPCKIPRYYNCRNYLSLISYSYLINSKILINRTQSARAVEYADYIFADPLVSITPRSTLTQWGYTGCLNMHGTHITANNSLVIMLWSFLFQIWK